MKKTTHSMIGLATGAALATYFNQPLPAGDLLTAIENTLPVFGMIALTGWGALMPDWDIKLGLKHRGPTHTLIALGLLALLCYVIAPREWWFYLPAGYASHLLADMLTISGIPLFAPLIHVNVRLAPLRTGGIVDHLLGAAAAVLFVWLLWK